MRLLVWVSRKIAALIGYKPAPEIESPLEMYLCEQNMVILKPNQLYIFRVAPDCDKCKLLEKLGRNVYDDK